MKITQSFYMQLRYNVLIVLRFSAPQISMSVFLRNVQNDIFGHILK
jgi:hypothetical protein